MGTPRNGLRAATMPPWAAPATHLGESILDLMKRARVCREQLLLEGVFDDLGYGRPPQLLGVREPHVDDRQMTAEPWPVLLEPVEHGVVGQHHSEGRQALVQVVEIIDEGTHLVIPNSVPTGPGGLPRGAGRERRQSGRRRLNNKRPIGGREHVRSMMVGLREGKGPLARPATAPGEPRSDVPLSDIALLASAGMILPTPELPPPASRIARLPRSPSTPQLVGDVGASPVRREVPVPTRRDTAMTLSASEPVTASFHANNATPSPDRLMTLRPVEHLS